MPHSSKMFTAMVFCGILFQLCMVVLGAAIHHQEADTELVLVHVIFRHGERTTYSFYPTDPHKNETFYPVGLGGLTNRGKMGEYQLGRFLREQYGDFLGDTYTEDKLYVRSTDVSRTKMSAQLVLAGLMPPNPEQTWNPELGWQPIPINYKSAQEEDILNTADCPFRKQVFKDLNNNPEIQEEYIKPYQNLYNYLSEKTGMKIRDPHDALELYFVLNTEDDLNLTLPEWTNEVYPEPLYSLASKVYNYLNSNPDVRRINSGYLLAKILKDTVSKIQNILKPSDRKMFLYSGHETTLGFMLDTLRVFKPHIPPYGSAIMFEVHRKNDEHFIKLRYRRDTSSSHVKDLVIPGCEKMCPVEKFILLQEDVLPVVPIKEACIASQVHEELQKQDATSTNQ